MWQGSLWNCFTADKSLAFGYQIKLEFRNVFLRVRLKCTVSVYTVEPPYNEPLYHGGPVIISGIPQPRNSKMWGTGPDICLVPSRLRAREKLTRGDAEKDGKEMSSACSQLSDRAMRSLPVYLVRATLVLNTSLSRRQPRYNEHISPYPGISLYWGYTGLNCSSVSVLYGWLLLIFSFGLIGRF